MQHILAVSDASLLTYEGTAGLDAVPWFGQRLSHDVQDVILGHCRKGPMDTG